MAQDHDLGLVKNVLLPALLVFLIPLFSLGVFTHAQNRYDQDAYEFVAEQVAQDAELSSTERAEVLSYWQEHPYSEQLLDPEYAAEANSTLVLHHQIFRWMIRLSAGSLGFGVLVFALAGLAVAVSRRSQEAQYLSLVTAWHTLRIYAAAQVLIQGVLLVFLSFWITALALNVFSIKLVGVTAVLVAIAAFLMLNAMWVGLDDTFVVEGEVLRRSDAPFWSDLDELCAKVGTAPPDQLIAGIDDNFFVTEHAVTVNESVLQGRTLYVSLSLLKQLRGEEADAVLAHEMAHFRALDTTFSKKTAPLLGRYDKYLQALAEGVVTYPIFLFMNCFRVLFELSIREASRAREFRADAVAAETTSPEAMAGALLRIAAYSSYRGTVERDLLNEEQAMDRANISGAIEHGFPAFAVSFGEQDLGEVSAFHPFDTHPKMAARLEAVGLPLSEDSTRLLALETDGRWFSRIPNAEALERSQWDAYEKRFRDYHEEVLAWRYLPATDAETALVLKFFPERIFTGDDPLTFTYTHMNRATWDGPIAWNDVVALQLSDNDYLMITQKDGPIRTVVLKHFGDQRDTLLNELNRYYQRSQASADYVAQRSAQA